MTPGDAPAAARPFRPQVTFSSLLRDNRNFRLLWVGQLVSQLGDWFNAVAVYALLLDLTGSATAVAAMMAVQLLPTTVVGPWAGVLVDRLDRKRVLVAADLVRGVLMLGLLLVRDAGNIWLAYAVIGTSVAATGFFEPARSALLPAIASTDELVPANALSSATWSAMLAIGAAAGGAVSSLLGRDVAFVLNSASFFVSALFIARMRTPPTRPRRETHDRDDAGFLDGLRFLAAHPRTAGVMSIKAVWAIAGGILLLLTVFGERVFRIGDGAAGGIGVLYMARGIGAGTGALAARWICGSDPERLQRMIVPGYLLAGLFYVCLGLAPTLLAASLSVVVAHAGGSLLWVSSTVLLQLSVPDRFRGRVFAIEFASMTLVTAAASYATGWALDTLGWDPRTLALLIGSLFLVPVAAWSRILRHPGLRKDAASLARHRR
jgi:MFS family permease